MESPPACVSPMEITVNAQNGSTVAFPVFTGNTIQAPMNVTVSQGGQVSSFSTFPPRVPSYAVPLSKETATEYQKNVKARLLQEYNRINEGIKEHGTSTILEQIYTELYITEGGSGDVNDEHEVREIEEASRRSATQEKPINCNDIFLDQPKNQKIRTVLTKGVAGIGKTVSVQKFILDWIKERANKDIIFIFPLPFKKLNIIKDQLSLMELLHYFYHEISPLQSLDSDTYKTLFIFDGLDECRLPLNFQDTYLGDVTRKASVDVLLTNLIIGNLLPSALLWITSRPAAANLIPPGWAQRVTEVRGFSDTQKEKYFRKRFGETTLANNIIIHVKSYRSLYIMCHIPVFCWIAATVLKSVLVNQGKSKPGEIPKTLTQMFTHFLIFQIKHREEKYKWKCDPDPQKTKDSILALGKLAFQQLDTGNLFFYEKDLKDVGIDVKEGSVYSGVCTQIFREEFWLQLSRVFSFTHLSVQEFLAALYAFLTFISGDRTEQKTTDLSDLFKQSTMSGFLKLAVDKALQSKNGHLDLFLRFLLGLSLESNQNLLHDLLPQICSHNKEETVQYIKEKIRHNPSSEKSINLFHCLNELNDHSLLKEVQEYVSRRDHKRLSGVSLSPAQWSALVFVLLNSEEELDEFNLRKYDRSEECLLRLLPVMKASRRALLCNCNLTEKCCPALASALSSNHSNLIELNLTNNDLLDDSGVELLSEGLKSSHCKLEKLKMSDCDLTEKSCAALAPVLSSKSSRLKELGLSYNEQLRDKGVERLCIGLKSPNCKLEKLGLSKCNITEEGFAALASALISNPSYLIDLNVSRNKPGESGEKKLSDLLNDPHFRLEKLDTTP